MRGWKGYQLAAIDKLFKRQWECGPRTRGRDLALALRGHLIWRVNALLSRPATGGSIHALHIATLPTTHDRRNIRIWDGRDRNPHPSARRRQQRNEEDEGEDRDSDGDSEEGEDEDEDDSEERSPSFRAPIVEHGVIWTRTIRLPGDVGGIVDCPRMSNSGLADTSIKPQHYRGIFGLSLTQVADFTGRHDRGRRDILIRRLPRPRLVLSLPALSEVGASASVILPPNVTNGFLPDVDQGDDLEQDEEEPSAGEVQVTTAALQGDIVIILNGLCSQSLQTIPVPRKKSTIHFYHTCRDPNEPYMASTTQFMEVDLQKSGFTHFQSREPNQDDWEDMFELILPPKHRIVRPSSGGRRMKANVGQRWDFETPGGYPLCSFHSSWQDAMSRCTDDAAESLRLAVKSQFFDKLVWVPWASKRRLWTTSQASQFPLQIPHVLIKGEGAPRICINPRKRNCVMWAGGLLFLGGPAKMSVLSSR